MPAASALRRLLSSNRTVSSAGVAAGSKTSASLMTALGVTTDAALNEFIIGMGQHPDGDRRRGIELVPVGVGADNSTLTIKVWSLDRGRQATGDTADRVLTLLATFDCTLSTAVGDTSADLVTASTERIADTVTPTVAALGTATAAAYGASAPTASSPADNTPARCFVPDVGNADVLVEVYVGTATSANVLYKTVT